MPLQQRSTICPPSSLGQVGWTHHDGYTNLTILQSYILTRGGSMVDSADVTTRESQINNVALKSEMTRGPGEKECGLKFELTCLSGTVLGQAKRAGPERFCYTIY